MNPNRLRSRVDRLALAVTLVAGAFAAPALALHPNVSKLFARNNPAQHLSNFGETVAVNEKYIVVGEPDNSDLASGAGAVHVYQATTGRFLRKLFASNGASFARFGQSVAVSGDLALVGAPNAFTGAGRAYLFDLRRGKEIAILNASDNGGGMDFNVGFCVALNKRYAVVGAPAADGYKGAVYVYDVKTLAETKFAPAGLVANEFFGQSVTVEGGRFLAGAPGTTGFTGSAYLYDIAGNNELRHFVPSDGGSGDLFGNSVALAGGYALVGAPSHDGGGTDRGAAYLYNIFLDTEEAKLEAADQADGDKFGTAVATQSNLVLVGAPTATRGVSACGAVYLFDLAKRELIEAFGPPDRRQSQNYGRSVALCGNRAVIGAHRDGTLTLTPGAVYVHNPLLSEIPAAKIAALRDFAPGAPDATLAKFVGAAISGLGESAFLSKLAGSGASGGRNCAFYRHDSMIGSLLPIVVTRDDIGGGVFAKTLGEPIHNRAVSTFGGPISLATLIGPAVNRNNNVALLQSRVGGNLETLMRTGDAPGALGGAILSKLGQPVQPGVNDLIVVPTQLLNGFGGTTKINDSAIVRHNASMIDAVLREGDSSPVPIFPGLPFGQLTRAREQNTRVVFPALLAGPPGVKIGGLFGWIPPGAPDTIGLLNSVAPIPDTIYKAFLGETVSVFNHAVWRASLSGTGVNRNTAEALFSEVPNLDIVAQKGMDDPGFPIDVKWARFLQYWVARDFSLDEHVLVLAKLSGPGVGRSNDCALVRRDENGDTEIILREGDPLPGCDPACVGTIQRVSVAPDGGFYAALVSLTAASKGTNQALLVGQLSATEPGLSAPYVLFRKGTQFRSRSGEATTVLSMSLPATNTDAAGAGGGGLGNSVSLFGSVLFEATFTNKAVELLRADP